MAWIDPQTLAIIGLAATQIGTMYAHLHTRSRERTTDHAAAILRLEAAVKACHDDREQQAATIEDLRAQIIALNAAMVRYLMRPGDAGPAAPGDGWPGTHGRAAPGSP